MKKVVAFLLVACLSLTAAAGLADRYADMRASVSGDIYSLYTQYNGDPFSVMKAYLDKKTGVTGTVSTITAAEAGRGMKCYFDGSGLIWVTGKQDGVYKKATWHAQGSDGLLWWIATSCTYDIHASHLNGEPLVLEFVFSSTRITSSNESEARTYVTAFLNAMK